MGLAIQIHNQYIETTKAQYLEKLHNGEQISEKLQYNYDNLCPYEELSPQLKIANIRQARSIPYKLSLIGCEMANLADDRKEILEFNETEVLELAKMEHEQWCRDKIESGWTYGVPRDDENFIHDCLLPWDKLTPEVQKYDIDPILEIPNYVRNIGLKIVETKTRLLTLKMHEFYMEDNESNMTPLDERIMEFDELPDNIKYSNYKQTDLLVKLLGELGYAVVERNAKGKSIESLDPDELEYLAETEHAAWCDLRRNFGWKYGELRDDDLKTNPRLLDWEDLDDGTRFANLETFKNLPDLCDQVGLKIIKND